MPTAHAPTRYNTTADVVLVARARVDPTSYTVEWNGIYVVAAATARVQTRRENRRQTGRGVVPYTREIH